MLLRKIEEQKDRKKKNLTETVRNYKEYLPEYFPIVHPSPLNFRWQAKNPWFEEKVVPELRRKVADAEELDLCVQSGYDTSRCVKLHRLAALLP